VIFALALWAVAAAEPDWLVRIHTVPPEIGASLLLKVADRDLPKRADLVEEAFRLGGQARMRWPEFAAVSPDSMEARRVEASFEQLDALNLQARAVEAMLRIQPRRALEMALEMAMPSPRQAGCSTATLPDLGRFYGVALQMGMRGFPLKMRAEGRHMDYLLRVLGASATAAHLAAAAPMVALYDGPEEEKTALISALAFSMRGARASPREAPLLDRIREAVARLAGLPGGEALAEAMKSLEASVLEAEPCPDQAGFLLWGSGTGAALREAVAAFRRSAGGGERELQFAALLGRIESWRGERETPAMAHFHMKALLLRDLLEMAPTEASLAAVISSYVRFLGASPAKTESPAEWVVHFRRLLLPLAPLGRKSVDLAVAEIRRSGDPLMNLLADAHSGGYF